MTTRNYQDQVVWIIGASSGIGLVLADELASRGAILALSARRKEELERLRSLLGVRHKVFALDVTDERSLKETAQAIREACGHIDRVIYMAAAYTPSSLEALESEVVKQIIDVNLIGAFNVIRAVIPIFKTQKNKGQLALCGSVAGYTGLANGQPYSASKAAIINLAESLYAEWGHIFDVKLISPGFVRTPLTDKNDFEMPMIINPETAAKEIADGLHSKHFEIHFPKRFTYLLKILRILPYGLSLHIGRMIAGLPRSSRAKS